METMETPGDRLITKAMDTPLKMFVLGALWAFTPKGAKQIIRELGSIGYVSSCLPTIDCLFCVAHPR
jgi:hypothetical protein